MKKAPELLMEDIVLIRSIYIKHLNGLIYTYENGYFPELQNCTGRNQYEHAEGYKRELEDINWNKEHKTKEQLIADVKQLTTVLQLAARDSYRIAQDFNENPFVCVKSLKQVIKLIQYLKHIEPRAEIYSNRFLAGAI